jgi:hypothetical protein
MVTTIRNIFILWQTVSIGKHASYSWKIVVKSSRGKTNWSLILPSITEGCSVLLKVNNSLWTKVEIMTYHKFPLRKMKL